MLKFYRVMYIQFPVLEILMKNCVEKFIEMWVAKQYKNQLVTVGVLSYLRT